MSPKMWIPIINVPMFLINVPFAMQGYVINMIAMAFIFVTAVAGYLFCDYMERETKKIQARTDEMIRQMYGNY